MWSSLSLSHSPGPGPVLGFQWKFKKKVSVPGVGKKGPGLWVEVKKGKTILGKSIAGRESKKEPSPN